jgi:Mrp family chromosome partitioning ATPase
VYSKVKGEGLNSLSVCGVNPQIGSSSVARGTALQLSEKNHLKVLLVDADLKKPSLNKLFDLPVSPGLAEILGTSIDKLDNYKHSINKRLDVITAGEGGDSSIAILGAGHLDDIMKHAAGKYDIVIFDSPALKDCADALLLNKRVGESILVVREGVTRRDVTKDMINKLGNGGISFSGVMLNGYHYYIPEFIYRNV